MRRQPRAERQAVLGLIVAMLLSAVAILLIGRDFGFWSDELDWLTFGPDFAPETLLTPHNSHLIAVPRFFYELFPRLFGADYLPFQLLSLAAVLTSCVLAFVLLRRRLGGPLALAPTLVLLFFGSSAEVVLSPLGLPISLSVAFGLATFVLIERDSGRGDLAAMLLLALSVLSDTFGAIIAAGVAIYLLLDPDRRRRLWIAAIPILLYVAWWIWARQFDQNIADAANLPGVPAFVIESAAATLAAITGIGKSFGSGSEGLETAVQAVFIALALAAAGLLALRVRRGRAGGPALWAFVLTILGFWVGVALSESAVRQPSTPRYLFFAAIMVFLIAAEALGRDRLRGRALLVTLIVLAGCLAGNVARLVYNGDGIGERVADVRAQLTAIELAGASAQPGFSPNSVAPRGSQQIVATAGALTAFTEEHGSLGLPLAELADQPEGVRRDADFVLASAIGVGTAPVPEDALGRLGACSEAAGVAGGPVRFGLPAGAALIRPLSGGESAVPVTIGRFGDAATVSAGEVPAGGAAVIYLPPDTSPRPWFAETAEPVEVCELPVGDLAG